MVAVVYSPGQLPLIEFIESDELFLQDEPQALWFDVLRKLDYRQFQPVAARYYEQLWQFNHQQKSKKNKSKRTGISHLFTGVCAVAEASGWCVWQRG